MQQCKLSDVQLLSEQQELHGDQDHLRLHLAAGDHRRLHHAVTRCGSAAKKGTSEWEIVNDLDTAGACE